MAYTDINFKTKKALKDALKEGKTITYYQPGGMFPVAQNGSITLEGPHYPAPHTWYANAKVVDGVIVSVK